MTFFTEVQTALTGAPIPLDPSSLKILWFVLERPDGCDITIAPDTFHIQYGWHLSYHRYFPELAPSLVSWLLRAAPTGFLPAGSLPWWFESEGFARGDVAGFDLVTDRPLANARSVRLPPKWGYGSRRIWFDASSDRVVVMVRDATAYPDPEPRPPPIEPPKVFLAGTHPCPHCGLTPDQYRQLRGGALVCLACGASSTSPAPPG